MSRLKPQPSTIEPHNEHLAQNKQMLSSSGSRHGSPPFTWQHKLKSNPYAVIRMPPSAGHAQTPAPIGHQCPHGPNAVWASVGIMMGIRIRAAGPAWPRAIPATQRHLGGQSSRLQADMRNMIPSSGPLAKAPGNPSSAEPQLNWLWLWRELKSYSADACWGMGRRDAAEGIVLLFCFRMGAGVWNW